MAGNQNRIEFTIAAKADTASFKALQDQLSNVGIAVERAAKKNGGMTQELKNAKSAAMELQNILDKSWNSNLGTYNMATFSQGLKASGKSLAQYKQQLSGAGAAGVTAWNQFGSSVMKANVQIKESNQLLNSMFTTMKNTVKWGLSSAVFNGLTSSLSQAYGFAQKLDSSLNDIRIVTGKSAQEMKGVAQWANTAAKNLSASTTDLTNAALIYYQQGDTEQEAQRKAEITTKVANVTNQDTATAADQMTAIWNGFQAKAEDMESYGDKMAKVAATTSSSFQELAAGMQKVAAASSTAGVSFDQLNAQMSTIVSVTREAPESVGTALKTIYARMGDLKTDGAATDEDGFTTKLGTVTADMSKMGINILDETGTMRELGDVIEEVGEKWQGWTRNQQEAAAVSLAGKRQYTQLIALFDNWDKYQSTLQVSQGAEGTLDEQQEIFEDRFTSAKKRLEAAKEQLYNDFFDVDEITPMIEAVGTLASSFDRLVKAFGGGTKALAAFGAMASKVFTKQINKEIATVMNNRAVEKNNIANANMKADMAKQGAADTKKAQEDFRQNLEKGMSDAQMQRSQAELKTAAGASKQFEIEAKYMQETARLQQSMTEEQKQEVEKRIRNLALLEKEKAELEEEARLIAEIAKSQGDTDLTEEKFNAKNNWGEKIIGERQDKVNAADAAVQTVESLNVSATDNIFDAEIANATTFEEKLDQINNTLSETDADQLTNSLRAAHGGVRDIQEQLKQANHEWELDLHSIQDVTQEEKRISQIIADMKTKEGSLSETEQKQLDQLKAKQGDLNDILDLYEKIKQAQQQGQNIVKNSKEHQNAKQDLENAKKYQQARQEANDKNGDIAHDTEQLDGIIKQAKDIDTVQQKVTMLTNGVSLLSSAWMGLSSLGQIWTDDDISTGEKLAQTITTLSMTLPMVISSWQGLTGAMNNYKASQEAINAIQSITNSQRATGILLTGAESKIIAKQLGIQTLKNIADKLGVEITEEDSAAQIANNILKAEGGAAALAEAGAHGILTGSFGALTASIWSATTAMWTFLTTTPIGWLILAAAAVVGLFVAFAKLHDYLEKNSPLAKAKEEAEQAKGATEQLADAVNELKGKYDELKSTISELNDVKDTLSGLTKGTVEWQEAVNTLNGKVLELIKLYPELATTLTTDEDGVMSVDSDALAKIQKEQADAIKVAQQTELQADAYANKANNKAKVIDKSIDIATSLNSEMYTWGEDGPEINESYMNYGAPMLSSDDVTAIVEKVSKGTDIKTALRDSFKATTGQTDYQIDKWLPQYLEANAESIAAMQELAGTISASGAEYKGIMNSASTQLLSGNATYENSEDKDALTALTEKQLEITEDDVKKAQEEHNIYEDNGADNQDNLDAVTKYFQELYNNKNLEVQYDEDSKKYQIKGSQDEDWTDVAQTPKETLQAAGEFFAVQAKTKSIDIQDNQNKIDEVQQKVATAEISQESANQLVNSLVKNNGKLTEEDLNSLSASDVPFLQNHIDYLQKVLSPYLEDLHIDSIDIGNLKSIENIDTPEGINTDDNTIGENKAVATNSIEGKKLLQQASKKGVDTGALATAMKGIDFTAVDVVGEFETKLEELGIILDESSPEYQAYIEYIAQINNKFRDGATQISGYSTALKGIEGVKVGDIISTEDYGALDESVKQFFEDVGDGTYKAVAGYDKMKKAVQEAYKMTEKDVLIHSEQSVQNMYADELKDLDDLDRAYADGIINEKAYEAQIDKRAEAAIEAGEMTREAYDSQIQSLETAIVKEQDLQKKSKQTEQMAKRLAAAINRQNAGFKSLSANIEDNIKNLKRLDKTSTEYQNSLANMKSSVSDIFNVDTSNISDSFITDNLDLLEKLSKGGKKAKAVYQELKTELANNQITMNIDESKIQGDVKNLEDDLTSQIEALDLPNLEVGASIDDSEYVATLENMVESGAITAAAAQQALSAIGFEAEPIYKTIREPIVEWSSESTNGNTAGASEMANHMKTVPVIKRYTEATVFAGLKTGSGGGYKGGDVSLPSASSNTSSGGGGSKGSGGSGKSGSNKVEKMDNDYDPYEKWEERLTQIQKKLDDIATISQNLDGEEYAKSLDEQNKLLEQRQKILKKEWNVAKKESNRSAKAMTGKRVKDPVTGEVTSLKAAARKAKLTYKPIYQRDENGKIMKDDLGKKIVDNQKTRALMVKKANKKKGKARENAQKFITDKLDPAISKNQESRDKYSEIDSKMKQEFEDWIQNRIDANSARFQVFIDTKQAQKDLDELNIDKLEQQLTKLDYDLSKTQRKLDNSAGIDKLAAYDEEQQNHINKAQTYGSNAVQKKKEVDDDTTNIKEAITTTNDLKGNNFPKGRQNKLKAIADSIQIGNDGEITNGDAILKALQNEEGEIDKALATKPTKRDVAKWKEYKAAVKELYDYVKSELSEQSSDLKDYYSNLSSADDERQAAEESAFAKFQYEWEIKIKDDEAKKAINQLGIELNKALQVEGDVFGKVLTALDESKNATLDFTTIIGEAASVSTRIDQEILKGEFNTLSDTVEMAETTRESLQNSISTMTSQISNLINLIPEVVGKSYSIFEEWHSMLERSNKMINTQSSIWKEFSDGSYSGLANNFLAQQTVNAVNENETLATMMPTYERNWKNSKTNFEKMQKVYYDSLTNNSLTTEQKRQITADYKRVSEEFKANEKKYTQSLDQMVANITTQISNSVTMMKNTICDIVEDSFADIAGQTLKASQTAYNWLQTTSKRYLDQTENPYQISQFSAYAEKAIADTDVVSNQLRLTSVYKEQLKILQEKDKLTQYDVDRAQKLLDLEIKRQALEDARNNKTSLKLRRDQSGNYSYQYVADEKKIAQAQSDYDKSKNDVYEMDKSNLASATSTFYSDMQAMQDELKRAYQAATDKNGEVDLEAFNAERDKIRTKYQDAMSSNASEVMIRFNNLKQSSGLDWENMDDASRESALRAAGIDPDILNTIQEFSDVNDWGTWFDSNFGEGSSYNKTIQSTIEQIMTLDDQLKELRETYEQNIPIVTDTMEKMQEAETESNTLRSQIKVQIQSLLEQIKLAYESIDKLTAKIEKINGTGNTDTSNATTNNSENSEQKKSEPLKGDSVNVSIGALYDKNGNKKKEKVSSASTKGWKIVSIDKSKSHPYKVSKNGKEGWVGLKRLSGFKSGGYTGEWNDKTGEKDNGKLAWLHQKELILNAKDTENMLTTVGMVRDLTGMLKNMQLDAFHQTFGMLEKYSPARPDGHTNTNNTNTTQTVHINANFPNVSDSNQIEKAFKNLANIALQKAAKATDMTTAQTTL